MSTIVLKRHASSKCPVLSLPGLMFLCIVMCFTSCKGFLNQNGASDQIKKAIDYENSPYYTIYVDYSISYGSLKYPSGGEIPAKVTDTFEVKFKTSDDYEFLYWEIINGTTKQKLKTDEYFEIASLYDPETEFTLLKAPETGMKLCLSPVVTARPKVISVSPKFKAEGDDRDTPIIVMFDQSLSPESIYYTQEEHDSLIQQFGEAHITFLPQYHSQFVQNKIYGYLIDNDSATTVFKNIEIVKNNTQRNNLLQYYAAPVFNEDKTQLTINVKMTGTKPDLPSGTSILVTIGKDFYSTSEVLNKRLILCESKKWPYFVK